MPAAQPAQSPLHRPRRFQGRQSSLFATPGYIYHNASPDGQDIFMVGDSLGIGSVAGWVDGARQGFQM
ncbi:MAG: DUF4861 family protein [Terriglobia bacterium]